MNPVKQDAGSDEGATAVEYAIMAGSIAAVIALVVASLGTEVAAWFATAAAF